MSSFWGSSIIGDVQNPSPARDSSQENSRCPDFIGFLAVCFTGGASAQLGLHPVLTDTNPKFEDVSMGGASFDVRKARSKSFPYGLNDQLFAGREFVVVKHPRVDSGSVHARGLFSEIATELQILRHPPLMKHENIVDFLTVVYHDAGELGDSKILPALVIEYAEFGSLNSYQASGYGRSVEDKIDIVTDVARGLEALHDSGIIHGDVKTSNMLVCKHPKRKFIVKLTDFGFSLSVDDDRLVGLTKKLEAPEASGTIEQRYLRQLDIYSYGLLLYTVFKNGALFYEGIPEEDRDSHVMKLKTTGLLAITTQINLLLNMSNEPCTLFLICKILAYALQPSPGRRFRSMSTIVNLLDFSKLPDDVYGKTFSNNSGQQQEQSGNAELSVEVFLPLQQNMSKTLKERVEEYCVSFSNDESPLLKVLKMELFKRVDYEISVFYGSIQAGSNTVTISAGRTDVLLKDSRGLLPESQLADCPMPANGASSTPSQSKLHFCSNFMPELSEISHILAKVPWGVQNSTIKGLEIICSTRDDTSRKAGAKLNLACACVNGIGIGKDLAKAAELVKEAAVMGSVRAQSLYVNVFSSMKGVELIDDQTLAAWLQNSANEGNPVALSKLRSVSEAGWANAMRMRSMKELFSETDESSETDLDLGCYGVLDWISWQKHFLRFAIVNGLVDFAKNLLDSDESLLHLELSNGETPLIASCRQGDLRLAKMLVEKGANPRQSTKEGVTALHWTVSFPSQEQELFVTFVAERGVDLEATAVVAQAPADVVNIAGLPITGTPLHWAIIRNDLTAVGTLLRLGANPTSRPPPSGGVTHLTPFELACSLCHSSIVGLLLRHAAIRPIVNVLRPLVENLPVLVRPLFFTLASEPRWQKLMRHGAMFEEEIKETIRLLLQNGACTDAVLEAGQAKMSAAFATAYHQCIAEIMRWGLEFGFRSNIDSTFGGASSGGTPIFLASTHRDREMFQELLNAGANVAAVDMYKFTPLQRAAKENDDVFFTQRLLKAGAPLEPEDPDSLSAFFIATHAGNLNVARYLYDQGADRDRLTANPPQTILATMLLSHTRIAAKRVEFLLSLPDRGSDGFLCLADGEDRSSAYHCAASQISENPDDIEITRIMMSLLLEKYSDEKYLNSTDGPHHDTTIGLATEAGNYKVVHALLKAGANPNIEDEYGRTALDKLYWRYCYPHLTEALRNIDLSDKLLVGRTLKYVNQNTSEILSLLKSYDAKANVFQFPGWFHNDSGYRDLDWVLARLQERRTPEAQRRDAEVRASGMPVWGDLPIRIPERPMQFKPK